MNPVFNPRNAGSPQSSPGPLLIVDDDEGICRLLASTLKKAGFFPHWCTSGAEAVRHLRENPTDLLLLDLKLPDMTGRELLELIAAQEIQIPYVVISGTDDMRVAVELMQSGALDYLVKDTQLLQLVAPVVRRCFERLRQRRQLEEAEERFFRLAANIDSIFWIAGVRMDHFVYVSPAYEKIWGRPVATVYENAAAWQEAVLPTDLPALKAALDLLVAGKQSMEIEYRIVRPDGEIRWLHTTASALLNRAGDVDQLSGFIQDITERKEISRRLLAAAEEERRRVGADLHDDLCQRLAAFKMSCALLARNLKREGSSFTGMARELAASLGDAAALSRNLAQGLSPVALDREGLEAALHQLAGTAESLFGVPVHFECRTGKGFTSPTTATHIYRITQELIFNAAKHAQPAEIRVSLRELDGCLILEVINDGKPFPKEVRQSRGPGMGLHLLRSRTDALGATLEFYPAKADGKGTRVLCTMPLKQFTL